MKNVSKSFRHRKKSKKEDSRKLSELLLIERKADLQEKKGELDEIVAETRQDEEKLREKAKKLEQQIEPRLLAAFQENQKKCEKRIGCCLYST